MSILVFCPMKLIRAALLPLVIVLGPSMVRGQDASTIIVPYSSGSNRTLGDAVNIAFPYDPVGRCITYQSDDLKWDTAGAISTDGKVSIEAESSDEKRTTDVALGYQANGNVKFGVFNANTKLDTEFTSESFREDAANTITLKFIASADYGRRMIENYRLDAAAPNPATDLDEFRSKCGTHFIRGERRSSELTILVRLKTTSQNGKDALKLRLEQTLGGGVSLAAVTGEAGTTFTGTYKSIIEYVKKAGEVTVEYRAHGGPGISAAGAAAKIVDPSDFTKLSETANGVAASFTQDNASITGYVLQSDTALGAPPATFDSARMEDIGRLTRRLLMLGDAAERYAMLKSKYPQIFDRYFGSYSTKVDVARAELVDLIKLCASGGSCMPPKDDILNSLHFLEEMFVSAEATISCQYQPADKYLPVVGSPSEVPRVLESISINLHGLSHNPDLIDFSSAHILRLSSAMELSDETNGFSGFALSQPNADKEKKVFGTIYSTNLHPASVLKYDASIGKYIVDAGEMQRRRDQVLDSAYSVYAPGPNGVKVSYDIGFPPRQDCPVVQGN